MKVKLGTKIYLFPAIVVVVGTHVNGKPNYTPVAHTGLLGTRVSICLEKSNYAYQGVMENRAFSINIPTKEQLVLVDYCGLVSGRDVDKGELFTSFYGRLDNAPMIEECPINMECRVESVIEFEEWVDGFVGEVIETHCDNNVLVDGEVDLRKVNPYFISARDLYYYGLGERIASDGVGKALKKGHTRS
jgi:flavin reductase (DIM6/NTAB) family NADH-FMN oxidoreductase RutF